jgi:GTPase SAR1 family protein
MLFNRIAQQGRISRPKSTKVENEIEFSKFLLPLLRIGEMNESLTTKMRRTQLNEAYQRGGHCPFFSKFLLPLQHLQLLQLPQRLHQLRRKPQVKLLMIGSSESGKTSILRAMIMTQDKRRYDTIKKCRRQGKTFESHGLQINITRIKSNESFLEIETDDFEKMTAVLFVFSLNDICQTKAGSIRNNNRVQNKQIFADVLKNEALSKTPIILILNKLDDFQEELKEAKFREEWRGYTGLQEETEILNFIEDDLRSLNHSKDRGIYIFRTIANNTEFMQQIFVSMISVIVGCHNRIEDNAGTIIRQLRVETSSSFLSLN